jgi:hypothetical protein
MFMYFMLSNVVIGVSDPVAQLPPLTFFPTDDDEAPDTPTIFVTRVTDDDDDDELGVPGPLEYSNSGSDFVSPDKLSDVLSSSLFGGSVNDMELGGWAKMSSCWSD